MPSNTPPAGLDDARTVAPKQTTKKTSAVATRSKELKINAPRKTPSPNKQPTMPYTTRSRRRGAMPISEVGSSPIANATPIVR